MAQRNLRTLLFHDMSMANYLFIYYYFLILK